MNHRIFLTLSGVLLLAPPMAALLPGCGGGNSGVSQTTISSTVALSPSQTGFLTLTTGGGSSLASGTLRVACRAATRRASEAPARSRS